MRGRLDPIRAVEACYAAEPDDLAWSRAVLEALEPASHGAGLSSFALDIRDPAKVGWTPLADLGPVPDWRASMEAAQRNAPPELIRSIYDPSPAVSTLSRRIRRLDPAVGAAFTSTVRAEASGLSDAIGMVGAVHDGRWIVVGILLPPGVAPSSRGLGQLRLVAAHLTSAWRLRRRLADDRAGAPPEAVLSPDGRLLDAGPAAQGAGARGMLAAAVRRMDRARGALRRTDPGEALSLWQGLVSGRWSLVDRVDADGRRYVLARRNDPAVRDPKALDEGERQVLAYAVLGHAHKYVGYLLGIAPSTVATRLASAQAKLGVRSRRELISLLGARGAGPGDPPER